MVAMHIFPNNYYIFKPHNDRLTVVITTVSPSLFPCYAMLANTTFLLPWKYNGENHKRPSHRRYALLTHCKENAKL